MKDERENLREPIVLPDDYRLMVAVYGNGPDSDRAVVLAYSQEGLEWASWDWYSGKKLLKNGRYHNTGLFGQQAYFDALKDFVDRVSPMTQAFMQREKEG